VILAEIALAAERLYREYLLDVADEAVEIALRDGGARRDLERLVARALTVDAADASGVAESLLVGGVRGSEGGARHEHALARFRRDRTHRTPSTTAAFLGRAAVPSLWGDTYAAATLQDGRGALFRVLVQIELAPDRRRRKPGTPTVTVDPRFSGDPTARPSLAATAARAVMAALAMLRSVATGPPIEDPAQTTTVTVFRNGLPWPLIGDTFVPTPFQVEQDAVRHDGSSMGLPIALAVLAAFLPQWTLREGPLCAATGDVAETLSVEAVAGLEAKTAAAAAADVPFLYPARGGHRRMQERFRHSAVYSLAEAAAEAFPLAGADVKTLLDHRPGRLYEREEGRQALDQAWDRVRDTGPRLLLVRGGSGIGKSTLVAGFVAEVTARGGSALVARAKSHESRVVEPLARRVVHGLSPDELRRHARDYGRWIASMVEPLGAFLPETFAPVAVDPGSPLSPRVLLEMKGRSLAALVRGCARRRGRLLVVLDDLQWGGEETWPCLHQLLDPSVCDPVLVVATYRSDTRDEAPGVGPALAELRSAGLLEEIHLDGLSAAAIRSWVAAELGETAAVDAIARAVAEVTAGNPLDVANHLRLLCERAGPGGGDPVSLVHDYGPEVIDKRLRVFAGLATLQLASIVRGADFSALLLQETGVVAPDALARDLASAQAARFVKPAGPGRYTFEHDRTREAVRRSVSDEQAARHSLALGLALERRARSGEGRLPVADLARYLGDAAPTVGGDVWKRALAYAEQAAEDMTGRAIYEDVREFRARAVRAFDLGDVDRPAQRAQLLLEAGRAHSYLGEETKARPYFEEARELALEAGLPGPVVEATLGYAGPPEDLGRTDDMLIGWLDEATALAAGAGQPGAARLRGRATFERVMAARREPAGYPMPKVTDLLDDARRSNDPVELAWALLSRLLGHYTYDEAARDRLAIADETLAVAVACGERDVEAWAQGFRVIHLLELGDRTGAEDALAGLARLGPQLHHGYARWGAAVIRPLFLYLDGRFADAHRLSDEALGMRVESPTSVVYQYVQRMLLYREEGRFSRIGPLLDWVAHTTAPASMLDGIGLAVQAARAALASDEGRLDDARRILDGLVGAGWQHHESDAMWATSLAFLAEASAATGDVRLVPVLRRLLAPRAGQTIVVALAIANLGAVDRYLGILAGLEQRWDDAEAHFRAALHVNATRLRSPTWEAHTQVDLAEVLVRRGAAGDRERARALAEEAATTAALLPIPPVVARARALLTLLGG